MSKELRWGVLGTASIAETVIPAIGRAEGCVVTAVASRKAERARASAERFGIARAFGSYEALLDSGEVDVIYLPLPNALHAGWTIRAVERGLPVLCEKPLATCAEDARRVADAAERQGVPVMEGYMYRFHPRYARVLELLAEGAVGRVTTIDATFTFLLDEPDSIVASAELGGGALLDVGCYPVDAARLIAGCEPTRVVALATRGAVDETLVGALEFPSGVLARFECSIASAERHRLEIAGTEATLVVDDPWIPDDAETTLRICRRGEPDRVIRCEGADAYALEVAHFAEVVRGGAQLRWPLADSVANMAVLDALARSA